MMDYDLCHVHPYPLKLHVCTCFYCKINFYASRDDIDDKGQMY